MKKLLAICLILVIVAGFFGCVDPAIMDAGQKTWLADSYAVKGSAALELATASEPGSMMADVNYNIKYKSLGDGVTRILGSFDVNVVFYEENFSEHFNIWAEVHYGEGAYLVCELPEYLMGVQYITYNLEAWEVNDLINSSPVGGLMSLQSALDAVNATSVVKWEHSGNKFTTDIDDETFKKAIVQSAILMFGRTSYLNPDEEWLKNCPLLGKDGIKSSVELTSDGCLKSVKVDADINYNYYDDGSLYGKASFTAEFGDYGQIDKIDFPTLTHENSIDYEFFYRLDRILVCLNWEWLDIPWDSTPFLLNDRTMLPARFLAEKLGGTAEYGFYEDGTIWAKLYVDGQEVHMVRDSSVGYINGVAVELDAPATLSNERFFLPVRFVCESLGMEVDYKSLDGRMAVYLDR